MEYIKHATELVADHQLSSYDLVPYESYPFAHLHPARIAATAQLRGMKPPPVATARVLDLGCGAGGHVIALAGFYPQMQLIGVDLAAGQIERGNQRIRDLGLSNVRLYAADLSQGLPPSALEAAQAFGSEFDYIVCQGVYYVVPDNVRSAIWRLLRKHLAPEGIAHLSFNTYPGWKQREVAQDFAQFHVQAFPQASGAQHEQAARDGLSQMAKLAPKQNEGITAGYGLSLQAEAQAAAKAIPGLLFHEFLSGDNRPLYFNQMLGAAQQAGLTYLSEATLPDAWPGRLDAAAAPLIAAADGDALRLEQYIDFATARTYRNSLWIAPEAAAKLPSALHTWPAERLHGLHIATDLQIGSAAASASAGQVAFICASGVAFSVGQEHAAALQALVRKPTGPHWVLSDALIHSQPSSAALLNECVLRGLLNAWSDPPHLCAGLKPLQASDWLRNDASRTDSTHLTTCWHHPVALSPADLKLLAQLDGSSVPELASGPLQDRLSYFQQAGWIQPLGM